MSSVTISTINTAIVIKSCFHSPRRIAAPIEYTRNTAVRDIKIPFVSIKVFHILIFSHTIARLWSIIQKSLLYAYADVAQRLERSPHKAQVTGSIPVVGTTSLLQAGSYEVHGTLFARMPVLVCFIPC